MQLEHAFRISNTACLALTGSGGKTTALFQLARRLSDVEGLGGAKVQPVIVTATTHLHVNQIKLADSHWGGEKPEDFASLEDNLRGVMLVTGPLDGDRTKGLDDRTIHWLHEFCNQHALPMLIEADGSRQRPLKAPGKDEPPIPDFVETVAVVAGLSGLGKPLSREFVHRPEFFARLSGLSMGATISPQALLHVLTHPAGGMKNIPARARRLVLLNQADTAELQAQAKALAGGLLTAFHSVIIASLGQSLVHAVYEPVAGIILAAGEARRFGQPKQLLDYHGQPFVRTVAKTALESGLSPVVVVTGANAEVVEAALADLPVTLSRNTDWQTGQSSSIRTGLQTLSHLYFQDSSPKFMEFGGGWVGVGAAIFLLADQPQVPPTLLRALMEQHNLELAPLLAPLVRDRRANPVLFDRMTFPDLLSLTGDVGGRGIFNKYPVTYLPWHDESLLLDIDTPEDLESLRDQEK
jgi:molybdenum cofactor cytidylyltransferase